MANPTLQSASVALRGLRAAVGALVAVIETKAQADEILTAAMVQAGGAAQSAADAALATARTQAIDAGAATVAASRAVGSAIDALAWELELIGITQE